MENAKLRINSIKNKGTIISILLNKWIAFLQFIFFICKNFQKISIIIEKYVIIIFRLVFRRITWKKKYIF
jgi:hypothetical protein